MSSRLRKMIGTCVVLAALPATAQNSSSQAGIAAFNEGDYQQALLHFRQAEQQGNVTDSLRYNLAVSLYRLGSHEEAKQYLLPLQSKPEWQVLVTYNLGLIAQAQGDMATARRHFQDSARQQENTRVSEIAARKLATLNAAATPTDRQRAWAALTSLSFGQDSNATSLADDLLETRSSAEDQFHEALLYGHWQFGRTGDGLRLYGLLYDRGFDTFDYLNSQVAGTGAVYEQPFGDYGLEAGLRINATRLDSQRVAEQIQLHAGVSRQFGFGRLGVQYAISRFEAGSGYEQIAGDQHRVELDWRHRAGAMSFRGRYRIEDNNREDLRRNGAFASYSPLRQSLMLEARRQFGSALSAGVEAEYVDSSYDGQNRLRDTDGQIRTAQRESQRMRYAIDAAYRLGSDWQLKLEYEYQDQRDHFDIYTYDKHKVTGSIEYRF